MSREKLVSSYWNARKSLEDENPEQAIKYLEEYSDQLPSEMSYEPKYWLIDQYLKVGNREKALESAKTYLEGCTFAHAAVKAKLFSEKFMMEGHPDYSFVMIRLSKKYLKLQEELRKSQND